MQSALDTSALQLELLKSLEPELVCEVVARLVFCFAQPAAVGVWLWDRDFESFSEHYRFAFGDAADELLNFLEETGSCCVDWDDPSPAMVLPDATSALAPLVAFKVSHDDQPMGLVLVAGDSSLTPQALADHLAHYPVLSLALAHSWEHSELKREVERLREQYEQVEIDLQEERRKNALNSLNPQATFRLEQSDKEKLVYEISNAVRSSLDINEVLQTAVNKIGATFHLSRCLVLWPVPESDQYSVYEYHNENVPSVKDLFFTAQGEKFIRLSTTKTAPHDFCDESEQDAFDREFLSTFGFLSGMLVPLIYHDRNIGSLFLQDCEMPREWSIDNTALIGSLADLISVAIEHANIHEEKKRQAVTDGLTGIANRRHFNETLHKEFERARRYGNSLSLVVVDLDYLKKINDTYGHHVGDAAIKAIGAVLSKSCRSVDLAARYGGEEFCLLLPDTDNQDAVNLAERVRKKIAETVIGGPGNISASIGVATYPEHASEPDELFEAADQALYAAKEGGRNRVVSAGHLPSQADH